MSRQIGTAAKSVLHCPFSCLVVVVMSMALLHVADSRLYKQASEYPEV